MAELLIIRHAIAHERDASKWSNDDERPLTEQGVDRFRRAARGLRRVVEAPDELLTSPLVRARQTASILEDRASFPKASELEALRADTELGTLLRALQERSVERTAVVGHEPDLSQLIAALLSGPDARAAIALKKGAVAQIVFAERVEPGAGKLLALYPPRLLRALAR